MLVSVLLDRVRCDLLIEFKALILSLSPFIACGNKLQSIDQILGQPSLFYHPMKSNSAPVFP